MKKALLILSAFAVIACGAPKDNTLSKAEKADGWELLFNGENTDGWHYYNAGPVDDGAWFVEDGVLKASGAGSESSGYIVTDKLYENFDLKWDWSISKGGNSGMIYHVAVVKDNFGSVPLAGRLDVRLRVKIGNVHCVIHSAPLPGLKDVSVIHFGIIDIVNELILRACNERIREL